MDSVRTLLGTLLMARSGLSTRTVRMADRLALCPSREYSITLQTEDHSQTPTLQFHRKQQRQRWRNSDPGCLGRSGWDTDVVLMCEELSSSPRFTPGESEGTPVAEQVLPLRSLILPQRQSSTSSSANLAASFWGCRYVSEHSSLW